MNAVDVRVHPLVLELMNRPQPRSGYEGKFSFQHCTAAALVDGRFDVAHFTDARVADPIIAGVRAKMRATADDTLGEDEAHLSIALADGRTIEAHIEHATGSPENPLSDAALEAKFRRVAAPVLGDEQAEGLLRAAWALDGALDLSDLTKLMVRCGRP